jgi:2-methylcitrate dehydratase
MMADSISRQIARFARELQFDDLPNDVVHEVKRYLYDSVGCAFGGFYTKDVQIMRTTANTCPPSMPPW